MYKRTYYTLEDLVQSIYEDPIDEKPFYLGIESSSSDDGVLENLIQEYFPMIFSDYWTLEGTKAIVAPETKTLFERYILSYYMKEVIGYVDGNGSPAPWKKVRMYKEFLRKFCALLQGTYDRYSKLVDYYKSKEDDLLEQIASTSKQTLNTNTTVDSSAEQTQRFNDTPQNGGDWSADDYTSTYQKVGNISGSSTANTGDVTVDSGTDGTTLAARLEEIRKLWKDVYVQWSYEFSGLFIDSAVEDDIEEV